MSIQLLESALASIRMSQPRRAAVALEALADDYNKGFRYKEAALSDDDLLKNFISYVDPRKLQGTKDDAAVMHLLSNAPAQSITWRGPVRLKTERNAINSMNTELTVNGVREGWLLDTGANFSVVTKSFASDSDSRLYQDLLRPLRASPELRTRYRWRCCRRWIWVALSCTTWSYWFSTMRV